MADFFRLITEFAENVALLIALTFLYSFVIRKLSNFPDPLTPILQGVLFGSIAVIGMQIPMNVAEGIIVDGRTVIVMLAAPFAGWLAGLVAGAIVAGYRLYLGGVGAIAGVGAIVTAMAVGLVFAWRFPVWPGKIKVQHLLAMALIMTAISLSWVFALPSGISALPILMKLLIPVGIMYPLTTVLLGLMLAQEHRRMDLVTALRDSEQRFRDFAESSSDWLWETDAHGRIVWESEGGSARKAGRRFAEIEGMTREEIAGDLMTEEEWSPYRQALDEHTDFKGFEYRYPGQDGTIRNARVDGKAMFDGSGSYLGHRGVASDHTELTVARQAQGKLSQAIENVPVGIALFDRDDRLVFFNNRYREMMAIMSDILEPGVTFEEMIRTMVARQPVKDALDNEEAFIRERIEHHREPHGPFDIRREDQWLMAEEVRLSDGGIFTIVTDVTDRKNLEEQLRRSQRMEAIGQLTGGVAHDFNNLMSVMIGNAELLEDRIRGDEEATRYAAAITRAVERGASLTNRLLSFSRKQMLSPAKTDVAGLIDGLADLLRRTLGETIHVAIEHGPDLRPAKIDPHQFEHALINLSVNARDAMPEGGALMIETTNVNLDQAYADHHEEVITGDYVLVAVSDTGTGMAPEVRDKVFEPFFTTKEVGQGSGLGLSMVYGFAKQSEGHVSVYSEPGRGTTVKLYVPSTPRGGAQACAETPKTAFERGTERILIVEDDESVREIPAQILRDQGYDVVEAETGDKALRHLKDDGRFDLLFTDVVLPGGMNGAEIAAEALRIQPGIKVLYTTGYSENAVIHHGQLDTGVTLITKPYQRVELLRMVRDLLEQATPHSIGNGD